MTDRDLQLLTWRFAAMVGLIIPDDLYATEAQVEKDRETWPELLAYRTGDPMFDFNRCAKWMVEISGDQLDRCRDIVFAEWGGDEDQRLNNKL